MNKSTVTPGEELRGTPWFQIKDPVWDFVLNVEIGNTHMGTQELLRADRMAQL